MIGKIRVIIREKFIENRAHEEGVSFETQSERSSEVNLDKTLFRFQLLKTVHMERSWVVRFQLLLFILLTVIWKRKLKIDEKQDICC